MVSFLKMDTKSELLGSLVTDAVAMELFKGASLLDVAESIEAGEVFPGGHFLGHIRKWLMYWPQPIETNSGQAPKP